MTGISSNPPHQHTEESAIRRLIAKFDNWEVGTSFSKPRSLTPTSPRTEQSVLTVRSKPSWSNRSPNFEKRGQLQPEIQRVENNSSSSEQECLESGILKTEQPVLAASSEAVSHNPDEFLLTNTSLPPQKPPRQFREHHFEQAMSLAPGEMQQLQQEKPKEAQPNSTSSQKSLNSSALLQVGSEGKGCIAHKGDSKDKVKEISDDIPPPPIVTDKLITALDLASEKKTEPRLSERKWTSSPNLSYSEKKPLEERIEGKKENRSPMSEEKWNSYCNNLHRPQEKKLGKRTEVKSTLNKIWNKITSAFRRRKVIENATSNRNDPAKNTETVKIDSLKFENPKIDLNAGNAAGTK